MQVQKKWINKIESIDKKAEILKNKMVFMRYLILARCSIKYIQWDIFFIQLNKLNFQTDKKRI